MEPLLQLNLHSDSEKTEAENRDRGRYTTGTLIAAVVAVVEIIHYFQR